MPLTQKTFWNTGTENKYCSSLNKQVIIMLVKSSNVKFTEQCPLHFHVGEAPLLRETVSLMLIDSLIRAALLRFPLLLRA